MRKYTLLIKNYSIREWKRTLFTVLGIMLSICLLSFSLIFTHNLKETIFHSAKYSSGYYHLAIVKPSDNQLAVIQNDHAVERTGTIISKAIKLSDIEATVQLMNIDNEAKEIFKNLTLLQGKFPEAENEIVLEEWFLEENKRKVAETLNLNGTDFKVVGVIQDQFNSKSNRSSYGFLKSAHPLLATGQEINELLYVQFNEKYIMNQTGFNTSIEELSERADLKTDQVQRNNIVYQALGEYGSKDYSSFFILIVNMIVMGLFIFNTFQITVMERIQQYGVFRAIGATPSQLYVLVLLEAVVISGIAIPLGIGLGYILQGLLHFISIFENAAEISVPFKALLGASLISFIVILLSVLRPAFTAGKVSPLMAINMTEQIPHDRRLKKKQHPFVLKHFGITSHLAWQNIRRHKTRFIVTTLSMSVAIVLFIINFSFFASKDPAALVSKNYLWDANYFITSKEGLTDQDIQKLKMKFSKIQVYPSQYLNVTINRDSEETKGARLTGYPIELLEKAEQYLVGGKLDSRALVKGDEVLLMSKEGSVVPYRVGDMVTIKNADISSKTVKIGAIVENYPTIGDSEVKIIAHSSLYTHLTNKQSYDRLDLKIFENDETHEANFHQLDELIVEGKLRSLYENRKSIEKDLNVFNVLMIGFISIIGFIGLFSIYNTLATSYLVRKKEFYMLRAIGMDVKQVRKMVVWEGFLYGFFSSIWGLVLGVFFHFLQYKLVNRFIVGFFKEWTFPITVTVIVIVCCLCTCILTSIFASRKLEVNSIVNGMR
jgi:putative ABC transport system permease protein